MNTENNNRTTPNEDETTETSPTGEIDAREDASPEIPDGNAVDDATPAAEPTPAESQSPPTPPVGAQTQTDPPEAEADDAANGGEIVVESPGTMKGAFEIVPSESDDPDEFNIKPLDNYPPPIPEVQRQINTMAYGVWGILKLLNEQGVFDQPVDKEIRNTKDQAKIGKHKYKLYNEFRNRVREAASVGVEGEHVHPKLSLEALQQIKDEVASRVGMKIKILYLFRLAGTALLIIAFAALFLVSQKIQLPGGFHFPLIPRADGYAWVVVGSMVGAWLSVASTRQTVSFEEIPSFLISSSEPLLRLVFVALLALAFALFIELKILVIVLGTADLAHFSSAPPGATFDPGIAVLLGLIAGISEKAVSRKVIDRARSAFADEE